MMNRHLCDVKASQLVVIDVQEKLVAAMEEAVRKRVIVQAGILMEAARMLGVPVNTTEQYPKGLGPTVEELDYLMPDDIKAIEKSVFSCAGSREFLDIIGSYSRRQVILCGMETHVCIVQTAMELLDEGYTVFVVEDAVCSRREMNSRNALERMRAAGVVITNTESVVFEWLRDAAHEIFKPVSALIK